MARPEPAPDPTPLASPFERWCELQHVRPDQPGAWEFYEMVVLAS